MRNAQILILCAFFVFLKTISAQPIRFNKAIETPLNPIWGWSIMENSDSTYTIISGNIDSFGVFGVYINFIDQNGNIYLSNGFKEFDKDHYPGTSNSGKRLSSGSYISVGGVNVFNSVVDQNAVLYKFSNNGDTIFKKYYDYSFGTLGYGSCASINNNVLMLGTTYDTINHNADAVIIYTDSSGNMLWHRKYGSVFFDEVSNAIEYAPEKFMVFGRRHYSPEYGAPWVLKINGDGNLRAAKWFYNLPNEPKLGGGFGATKGLNNDIVIHGYFDTTTTNPPSLSAFYAAFLATMDTNMNLNIIYTFNEPDPSRPYIIKQIKDSSYVAIGYKEYSGAGFISKINFNGQLIWEREYVYGNQYDFNYFADFVETFDGGFILSGSTIGDVTQDLWLVKLDSFGLLDSVPVNTGTVLVNSSDDIQLYPNPAQHQLNIKVFFTQKQNETTLLTVYDMLGKQVITENIVLQQGKANHTIDVSNLVSGSYILTVQSEKDILKKMFLKE